MRLKVSPALGLNGYIYIGSNDNKLYALDSEDGSKLWEFSSDDFVWSSPSIGADGTVYVGSNDNKLYSIDPLNGQKKWEYEAGGQIWSSPVISRNGFIFFGTKNSELYALDIKTKSETNPWSMFGGDLHHRNNSFNMQSVTSDLSNSQVSYPFGNEDFYGWRSSTWFGLFYPTDSKWTYHFEHKWIFVNSWDTSSFWYWDQFIGWCWTNISTYPNIYTATIKSWIFYEKDSINPRKFYKFATNDWFFQ